MVTITSDSANRKKEDASKKYETQEQLEQKLRDIDESNPVFGNYRTQKNTEEQNTAEKYRKEAKWIRKIRKETEHFKL